MDKELKVFGIKNEENKLPELVSKGTGMAAEIILNKAKKEGIEIVKDSNISELLGKLDMYDGIPDEAYKVITEILMYVYKIEKEVKTD